jgi:BioD-like phosphotransacetylase family protein
MVFEGVGGELVHRGPDMDRVIGDIAVGAMEPEHMLQRIGPQTLVIAPGDREDVITALVAAHLGGAPSGPRPGEAAGAAAGIGGPGGAALGLVLTGGYRPRPAVLDAIRGADLFAVLVREDTYAVARCTTCSSRRTSDREKIEAIGLSGTTRNRVLEAAWQ